MNWDNITERDYQFEEEMQFSEEVDYIKELDEYKRYNEERDQEGRKAFIMKHNGEIAFGIKYVYYKIIKKAGLI